MYSLDRDDLMTVMFVFLTVIALGTVAATIDSITGIEPGDRQRISLEDRGGGLDSNVSGTPGGPDADINGTGEAVFDLVICIEFLRTMPAILGIVLGLSTIFYGAYRLFNIATALLTGVFVVPFVWVGYFLTTNCVTGDEGGPGLFSGASVVTNEGGVAAPPLPPAVAAGIFGLVMLVGVVLLVTMTDEEETFEPIQEEPDTPDTAAFSRAAGRAADRIEEGNVPVDNAVYRAWLEMTTLLNLEDAETTAPRDFAREAVKAGLDRDDVEELTELFNEVRYGDESPDVREDRAIEILRNIERMYEDSDSSSEGEQE